VGVVLSFLGLFVFAASVLLERRNQPTGGVVCIAAA
jgi:hypothetical protein